MPLTQITRQGTPLDGPLRLPPADGSWSTSRLSAGYIADYKPFCFVDGPGVRCSLYVSGCPFACAGCYNLAAQSFRYVARFGEENFLNEDINKALDMAENGEIAIPEADMLVGGFPCQYYSVSKPLSQSHGIEGKKGVLWWDIYRALDMKKPRYVVLENVDRLLKSPSKQRGRDFAIILSCFYSLGYSVEWRVINAADYGHPQKRKRVYIYAELTDTTWDLEATLRTEGVFAEAFPITQSLGRRAAPLRFRRRRY